MGRAEYYCLFNYRGWNCVDQYLRLNQQQFSSLVENMNIEHPSLIYLKNTKGLAGNWYLHRISVVNLVVLPFLKHITPLIPVARLRACLSASNGYLDNTLIVSYMMGF